MKIWIEAYSQKWQKTLFTAEVHFGPDYIHVLSTDSEKYDPEIITVFLEERARHYISEGFSGDNDALERLKLTYNRHLFGRMSEAYVLLAMLDYFALPSDSIVVHPVYDTLLCMYHWAPKYGTFYPWKRRKQ